MAENESHLTNSRLRWRPSFLLELESLSEEVGFIDSIHQTLEQDNITVDINGDLDRLREHEEGILFAGDHKNQWEFIALMDMLSRMNRDDMLNIAKFYVQRQVHQALGRTASKLVVPVYPRILASDRGEFFNSETLNRILYRKFLLTLTESAEANSQVIDTAVGRLVDGGVVNIFPTGSVVNSLTHPWRNGVGRIIADLDRDSQHDTLISTYNIDDISKVRLIGAIAMCGHTLLGKPQTIKLNLGPLQTASDLIGSLHKVDRDDPIAITQRLRQDFLDHFSTED